MVTNFLIVFAAQTLPVVIKRSFTLPKTVKFLVLNPLIGVIVDVNARIIKSKNGWGFVPIKHNVGHNFDGFCAGI